MAYRPLGRFLSPAARAFWRRSTQQHLQGSGGYHRHFRTIRCFRSRSLRHRLNNHRHRQNPQGLIEKAKQKAENQKTKQKQKVKKNNTKQNKASGGKTYRPTLLVTQQQPWLWTCAKFKFSVFIFKNPGVYFLKQKSMLSRVSPTGHHPQNVTHRMSPTGYHPQDITHSMSPTGHHPLILHDLFLQSIMWC